MPFQEFYNDVINEEISFRDDYQRWVVSRDLQRRGAGVQFSFCGHAYVLDAAAKSAVLRIDASQQMRRSYMRWGPRGHGAPCFMVANAMVVRLQVDAGHGPAPVSGA